MQAATLIAPSHPYHSTMSHQDPNGPASTTNPVKSESPTPKTVVMPSPPQQPVTAPATGNPAEESSTAVQVQVLIDGSSGPGLPETADVKAPTSDQAQAPQASAEAQAAAFLAAAAARGRPSSSAAAASSVPVPAASAAASKAAFRSPPSPPSAATIKSEDGKMPASKAYSSNSSKARYKKRTKKYNNFNIFFMLERQLLLQSRGGGIDAIKNPMDCSDNPMVKYKALNLPPLCRRYEHLPLTSNWFLELLASQNKKRPHRKSHGLIPFKELAQTVAKNYREIDDETQSFVNEVAERLGWHCEELELAEEKERIKHEAEMRAHGRAQFAAHFAAQAQGPAQAAQASSLGASIYAGKKRKDAPVVYQGSNVGGPGKKGLSHDEAATVQQLMGMKSTSSPKSAAAAALAEAAVHRTLYPPPGPRDMAHLGGTTFPPTVSSGYPMQPHSGHHLQQPPNRGDIEADRLQLELAHAMNARLESERRIQHLKDQMSLHRARQQAHGRGHPSHARAPGSSRPSDAHTMAGHPAISPNVMRNLPPGYEHYLSMLTGGPRGDRESDSAASERAAPSRPRSNPSIPASRSSESTEAFAQGQRHSSPSEKRKLHPATIASLSPNATLEQVENALLKEALLRGLIPPGGEDGAAPASAPPSAASNPREQVAWLESLERSSGMGLPSDRAAAAPLKKRARHSLSPEAESEAVARLSESHERATSEEPHTGRPRSASDMSRFKDLYASIMARPPSTGAPRNDSLEALIRENPSLARELASRRDPLAAMNLRESAAAREAAFRDLTARDAANSRDRAMFDSLLGRGSNVEQRMLLESLSARGPTALSGPGGRYPASSHPSAAHYPPSNYPSNHGQSYMSMLSQMASDRQASAGARHNRTPPPPVSAASPSHSQGPGQKPSLLEMVHDASRNSQFGLSYNDIMDVWKEMNKEKANNGGGHSPEAHEGDDHVAKKERETDK